MWRSGLCSQTSLRDQLTSGHWPTSQHTREPKRTRVYVVSVARYDWWHIDFGVQKLGVDFGVQKLGVDFGVQKLGEGPTIGFPWSTRQFFAGEMIPIFVRNLIWRRFRKCQTWTPWRASGTLKQYSSTMYFHAAWSSLRWKNEMR